MTLRPTRKDFLHWMKNAPSKEKRHLLLADAIYGVEEEVDAARQALHVEIGRLKGRLATAEHDLLIAEKHRRIAQEALETAPVAALAKERADISAAIIDLTNETSIGDDNRIECQKVLTIVNSTRARRG